MTTAPYQAQAPDRAAVDAWLGPGVIEFGTDWCGHCRAAQALIAATVGARPGLRHLKVEDGPGRPLGRSFGVKRWPTLVFLRDGRECARVVRPTGRVDLDAALASLDA